MYQIDVTEDQSSALRDSRDLLHPGKRSSIDLVCLHSAGLICGADDTERKDSRAEVCVGLGPVQISHTCFTGKPLFYFSLSLSRYLTTVSRFPLGRPHARLAEAVERPWLDGSIAHSILLPLRDTL